MMTLEDEFGSSTVLSNGKWKSSDWSLGKFPLIVSSCFCFRLLLYSTKVIWGIASLNACISGQHRLTSQCLLCNNPLCQGNKIYDWIQRSSLLHRKSGATIHILAFIVSSSSVEVGKCGEEVKRRQWCGTFCSRSGFPHPVSEVRCKMGSGRLVVATLSPCCWEWVMVGEKEGW